MTSGENMKNLMDLSDKRILVTGSSSGIGRATSVLLSKLGAALVLMGRNKERLKETEQMLAGDGHLVLPLELKDFDKYTQAFNEIRNTGEKLSGMVHCAGIAKVIPIKVASVESIHEMLDVNFVSFMELVKHYSKKTNSLGGSIVCLSAINAHYPQKCMSIYAATKGALEMAVSSLAVELFDKDIRVNAVVPGPIATPMADSFGDVSGEESDIVGRQLISLGEPEDIANMTAYLLSEAAKFITGRKFYVDGGRL